MILVEIGIGVAIVLVILAIWWHAKVVADNERLRDLFGIAYQKFGAFDDMEYGDAKDRLGEDIMDVLSDPDSNKAQQWFNEPGVVRRPQPEPLPAHWI